MPFAPRGQLRAPSLQKQTGERDLRKQSPFILRIIRNKQIHCVSQNGELKCSCIWYNQFTFELAHFKAWLLFVWPGLKFKNSTLCRVHSPTNALLIYRTH